jgi:membrane protein DedA with SNARE-associated domain
MDILLQSTSFSNMVQWTLVHGYWLMLIAMIIEGPIVTSAAAFATVSGYFNLYYIFILSLLGDLIGDIVYYAMGYWGRMKLVERFGHKFGLSKERLEKIDGLLNNHPIKTLTAIKLNPLTPLPGLMLVGASKMPLKKYVVISLAVTMPKSILFIVMGYYFGNLYDVIAYYGNFGFAIALIVVLGFVALRIYRKISYRIANKIEKI